MLPEVAQACRVIAMKGDSHELARRHNQLIDLPFLVGAHEYASVCQDITDWVSKITGIAFCHDYKEVWPTVKQSCDN
jgi:hypothetical protein